MFSQGLLHTLRRYQTLRTHRVSVMPIVILMPHSACNCRCVMCDIWKGNSDKKQLTGDDIRSILVSLKKLNTKRVVMSGGEALLNKHFFTFCRLLKKAGMRVTLLSTGLTLERHAKEIVSLVDEVIVSLDGDERTHDEIRNISGAHASMKKGISALHAIDPGYRVSGRSVIHRLNYKKWPQIVLAAKELALESISFLPADVTSEAFNRQQPWNTDRQQSVLVPEAELDELHQVIESLVKDFSTEFAAGYIAESPAKIRNIGQYYAAHHGLATFPEKKCNAPWVSAVVEANGDVRPCFFHDVMGNVRQTPLHELLNSDRQRTYRQTLDIKSNETCKKCVCFLNLPPRSRV